MVASKVTISPETKVKLNNVYLSPQKKRELREEMIKERIRNTPDGFLTKQELVAAAGLDPNANGNEYARGVAMLGSMIKRGIIAHEKTHKFRKSWCVISDAKVTTKPEPVEKDIMPREVMIALTRTVDKMKLVDMAKEFAWRENSDSLRAFIIYAENTI